MVGLCGSVGAVGTGVEPVRPALSVGEHEETTSFMDDRVEVIVSAHPQFHADQPATLADGSLLWIHGSIFGFDGPTGYVSRPPDVESNSRYCAELFDTHGIDFVHGLNGEFVGLVFDPSDGTARLFTDRIGSIPLFYTRTDDALLFATRLQAIGLHPAVTPAFDRDHLAEFFAVQKAFGTASVLRDVSKIPPASVLTIGVDASVQGREIYWRPRYRPVDRTPSKLGAEIAETVATVIEDRVREDLEYGVMLSGGTDSRLVLGGAIQVTDALTAFHLTNWQSRETRVAERVAERADVELCHLRRDRSYHADLLERVPQFSNFVGCFDEYIASGFEDELATVDVLLSGYLGDTLFDGFPIYKESTPLPFALPIERQVDSVADYVERYLDRYGTDATVPPFLDAPAITDTILERIQPSGGSVSHHGVPYHSLRELQLCEYYPLTNQFAWGNTDSLRQITGHTSPFFDNRLLELHLTIPVRDRLQYEPIGLALTDHFPGLASIPHPTSGVSPAKSGRFGPSLLGRKAIVRLRRRMAEVDPPEPFLDHGPWMDEGELIGNCDFIERAIERNEQVIAALPFLDGDEIDRYYKEHLSGENHWRGLYALVTLLEAPVTERIAQRPL